MYIFADWQYACHWCDTWAEGDAWVLTSDWKPGEISVLRYIRDHDGGRGNFYYFKSYEQAKAYQW